MCFSVRHGYMSVSRHARFYVHVCLNVSDPFVWYSWLKCMYGPCFNMLKWTPLLKIYAVVIMHYPFCMSIEIMDKIKELIMSMMQFIVLVMAEYASTRCIPKVRFVHNLSLQDNAWLMEMFNRSFPVRCRCLLPLRRHVFIRLYEELRSKNYL